MACMVSGQGLGPGRAATAEIGNGRCGLDELRTSVRRGYPQPTPVRFRLGTARTMTLPRRTPPRPGRRLGGDKPPEQLVAFDPVLVLRRLPVAALTNRSGIGGALVQPLMVMWCPGGMAR